MDGIGKSSNDNTGGGGGGGEETGPSPKRLKNDDTTIEEEKDDGGTSSRVFRLFDENVYISSDADIQEFETRFGVSWDHFRTKVCDLPLRHLQRMSDDQDLIQTLEVQRKAEMFDLQSLLRLLRNPPNLSLTRKGTDSSHTNPSHDRARYKTMPFELCEIPIDNTLTNNFEERLSHKTSQLLVKGNLKYFNESDVQDIVHRSLDDAVKICDFILSRSVKLTTRREASILSFNKPDHTVVFAEDSNVDVVVLESKKERVGIEDKEKVIGQIYDFMSSLDLFGHPSVFGVLTTFTKSWVYWLNENSSEIAKEQNRFTAENINLLKERLQKPSQNSSPAPPKHTQPVSTTGEEQCLPRIAYRSQQEYNQQQLVPLLCNVIISSLRDFKGKRSLFDLEAMRDTTHTFDRVLVLQETKDNCLGSDDSGPVQYRTVKGKPQEQFHVGYEFKKNITLTLQGPLIRHNDSSRRPRCFYVVDKVGAGSTSRVFRALSGDGSDCVIKMYVKKYDGNRVLTKDEFLTEAKTSVMREVDCYQKVYGDELKDYVYATMLNGFYCVILPYFRPPTTENDRTGMLYGVRQTLFDNFVRAECSFSEDDMRWRHTGTFRNKTYLFDLADLVPTAPDIDKHVSILRNKM